MKHKPVVEQTTDCQTRYPIVLVHGAGFRDDNKFYNYWGRIPAALQLAGAQVFYSRQDAWGSVEANAQVLQANLRGIMAETGAVKVNLIAHSKGGLEARYLISSLGMAESVATLTTISTPHRGSLILDWLCAFPRWIYRFVAWFVDLFSRLLGDRHPDFYTASRQLSRSASASFNRANPDAPGVAYRSYAGKMRNPFSDLIFFWTWSITRLVEGPNDGLVPVESAKWGDYRGEISGNKLRGVSHSDTIDLYRWNSKSFDIVGFYRRLAATLKTEGY